MAAVFVVGPGLWYLVITISSLHRKTLSDKLVTILIALATAKRDGFSPSVGEISVDGEDSAMANGWSLLTPAKKEREDRICISNLIKERFKINEQGGVWGRGAW